MSFSPTHPFSLPLLPPKIDPEGVERHFARRLLKAGRSLAELKGYSPALPNPMLLLSPTLLKESVASSKIEAIHTTLEDALQQELFPERERRQADKEVLNYRDALLWGNRHLATAPISSRCILGIHERVLSASTAGTYRKLQNSIKNDATGGIVYTPPLAARLPELLSNWERFANEDHAWDPLLRAILCHYQFEAIHPFGDGNGRTGRILFILQLVKSKLLDYPILYLSGHLNEKRADYYLGLNRVSSHDDWLGFIEFMLDAVAVQAGRTKLTLFTTMALYERTRDEIKERLPKVYSADLVRHLFSSPYTIPSRLAENLKIHYVTAGKYLSLLEKGGWLKGRRAGKYHLYANHGLLELLKEQGSMTVAK